MNLTHPFSINEFTYGSYTYATKELVVEAKKADLLRGNSGKGKMTTGYKREYQVTDTGSLHYKQYLGVEGNEPYHHLTGNMNRVD